MTFMIFSWSNSFGQVKRTYTFNEIGWTITLPNDFEVEDSITFKKRQKEGIEMLERSTHLDISSKQSTTLISDQKDAENIFTATLARATEPNEHYWDSINNNVIKLFYKTMVDQAPNLKLDSSRTITVIDGVKFKEFDIVLKMDGKLRIHSTMLWKFYKGYTFSITYLYNEESTGDKIRRMLRESHFSK